jgi:hypothetical protein
MKTVSEEPAPAAELEQHLETPNSMEEAMETGFLPDDEHYRLTGEFKPERKEDSAAPKPQKEQGESENTDGSAPSSSENRAASETAQPQNEEKEASRQSSDKQREPRWKVRERELKEARAEVARLKAQQTSQPQPRSETAQPSIQTSQAATETKAAPKPKIDDVDEKTGKPKYQSYAEYEDAKDQWLLEEGARKFQETSAKTDQQRQQEKQFEETKKLLTDKFAAARAKYPDFDKVALNDIDPATGKAKYLDSPVLFIPVKSVTDDFIVRSPHGGEVLYYLGQHPEITQGFYGRTQAGVPINLIHPLDQTRKLMEIEAQFSGTAASDKSGDDKSSSSSAKPITQASRPPHQVSGTGTVAKDAVEQAIEDQDSETYIQAQNARDPRLREVLKRRK